MYGINSICNTHKYTQTTKNIDVSTYSGNNITIHYNYQEGATEKIQINQWVYDTPSSLYAC